MHGHSNIMVLLYSSGIIRQQCEQQNKYVTTMQSGSIKGGLHGQDMRYEKKITVSIQKLKGKRPSLHSCYRA